MYLILQNKWTLLWIFRSSRCAGCNFAAVLFMVPSSDSMWAMWMRHRASILRFVASTAALWFTVKDSLQVVSVWSVGCRKSESESEEYTYRYTLVPSLIGKIDYMWLHGCLVLVHPVLRQSCIWIVLLFQVGARWSSARRQAAASKLPRTRVAWDLMKAMRPKRSPKHTWCRK